jgi:hypothetical protein
MMRQSVSIVACLALFAISVSAQEVSLKVLARQRGGRATQTSFVDSPVKTLPELVSEADAIVEGGIAAAVSRLSSDESRVFTDLTVIPLRILKSDARTAAAWTSSRPIIVQMPGGTLVDDGLQLTSINEHFRDGLLSEGVEIIAFVKYYEHLNSYVFHGAEFGVFRIESGQVKTLTARAAERRGDRQFELADFTAAIERLRR